MTEETITLQGKYVVPVIYCKETADNWIFLCKFCKRIHYHGKMEGHRNAHCHNPKSPYAYTGYYIKLKKEATQ